MMRRISPAVLVLFFASMTGVWAVAQEAAPAAAPMNMSEEEQAQFLSTAKVIASRHTSKGVTSPWRLTLTDGKVTHDASFQSVEIYKQEMRLAQGTELNFHDSWKFNVAGYRIAKMLGLDNMVPVYVERKWEGKDGSISWWIPDVQFDEGERISRHIAAPDPQAWNDQMYKIRLFDQLLYDTDPNLTNVLITKDWKIWRIDFTRAFRTYKSLQSPKDLKRCDKALLEKLKALNQDQVMDATKGYLSKGEVKSLMARRDKIVEHFDKLVAKEGEAQVLY